MGLRAWLSETAERVDAGLPANGDISINPRGEPVLRRHTRRQPSAGGRVLVAQADAGTDLLIADGPVSRVNEAETADWPAVSAIAYCSWQFGSVGGQGGGPGSVFGTKNALTVRAALMVMLHGPVPLHEPSQWSNT
jgi:hypothetical protein